MTNKLLFVIGFFLLLIHDVSVRASDAKKPLDADDIKIAENEILAEINLSNGSKVRFLSPINSPVLILTESFKTGTHEVSIIDQIKGDYLQLYLQLTPEGTPIPKKILNMSIDDYIFHQDDFLTMRSEVEYGYEYINPFEDPTTLLSLSKRATVLRLKEPIDVKLDQLAVSSELYLPTDTISANKGYGQGSCNSSTGYQYFKDNHCKTGYYWGEGSNLEDCDNAMHHNNLYSSGLAYNWTARTIYSRTVACMNTDINFIGAVVRHYFSHAINNGGEYLAADIIVHANTMALIRTKSPYKYWNYLTRMEVIPYVSYYYNPPRAAYVRNWALYTKRF